jgi:16S rRNA C1402 N4-methylase RsmH
MTYLSLTDRARAFISAGLRPGDYAVDATLGNGHDCLFLAQRVGRQGLLLGFDIQQRAIQHCHQLLQQAGCHRQVRLIRDDHRNLCDHLQGRNISAAMFNLGYLPGGDRHIITTPASTLQALQCCCRSLRPGGRISVIAYSGHSGGQEESERVTEWLQQLDSSLWRVDLLIPEGRHDPPRLICCARIP